MRTTNFILDYWCPNCRVQSSSFIGEWVGVVTAGIGSVVSKLLQDKQVTCEACKFKYKISITGNQVDNGFVITGVEQKDL